MLLCFGTFRRSYDNELYSRLGRDSSTTHWCHLPLKLLVIVQRRVLLQRYHGAHLATCWSPDVELRSQFFPFPFLLSPSQNFHASFAMSSASTMSKTASRKASSTTGLVPPFLLPRPKSACGEKNGQCEYGTSADASVIIGICKSEVDRRISEVLLKISENTAGVNQSVLGLEARISQLKTKTSDLEQQLTTAGLSSSVVGNVQTLRRDVNSLLEQQGPRDGIPEVAAENNRAAGILPELTTSQDRVMVSLAHRLEALESKELV